ncbi:glycosyltransferase family 4 protein [Caldanaerobacter subterraneus]|uniref:Glycosyltransferase family 4 protein n=1 Tax=Caldanaerobacter subterraneus TaxID=911092 RepID=A0A7Y2L8U6_9THEO|nr:glycosyltransferase family 4 protein [Caldanaerobacter subterraneus]NNG67947.1 glycosyltransferase family 4 protein [Caldanaerobacter subterraneus]
MEVKPNKILLACTHAGTGGVARHVLDLALILKENGYKVDIATGTDYVDFMNEFIKIADNVIKVKHLKRKLHPINDLLALQEVKKLLLSRKYDIIHAHGPKAGFIFREVAYKLGIPVVYTHHLVVYRQFKSLLNPLYKKLELIASKHCDHVITVSNSNKEILINDKIVDPRKISVVYNGLVDLKPKYERLKARSEIGIPKDTFVVVYVGRLERPKDPLTLVRAFKEASKKIPNSLLLLIGDGPLRSKIVNESNIKVTGFIKEVEKYLAAADVFVLTTNKEGLPISILEAMKYSLPIIATNVDGIPEEVYNGVNGYLINKSDSKMLSKYLVELYIDEKKRREMGEASYSILKREFDFRRNVQKIMDIYDQVL